MPRSNAELATCIRTLLDEAFDRPITLQAIADRLHQQPSYISRVFRRAFGCTPHGYVELLRMRRAVALLREGQTIEAISRTVGYRSSTNFHRSFRAHFGRSPGEYRVGLRRRGTASHEAIGRSTIDGQPYLVPEHTSEARDRVRTPIQRSAGPAREVSADEPPAADDEPVS